MIEEHSLLDERPARRWIRRRHWNWMGVTLAGIALLWMFEPALALYPLLGWYSATLVALAVGSSTVNVWVRDGRWPPTAADRRRLLRRQGLAYAAGLVVGGAVGTLGLLQLSEHLGR